MKQPGFFDQDTLVSVMTLAPLDSALDYRAPKGGCDLGAYVEVPLGPRKVLGVVWGAGRGDYDLSKIRVILRVLDIAPMRAELQSFLERGADYTLTPHTAMLRLATRVPGLSNPPSMRKIYFSGTQQLPRMTAARRRVLETFESYGGLAFTMKELANIAAVSPTVIKGMVALGAVKEEDTPRDLPFARLDTAYAQTALTPDQDRAAAILMSGLKAQSYGTTLLKGVTGSGKTEVYLEAVAECLRQGRQALVLLPEIALTVEFLDRVEARFGTRPAEWHSGVTLTERRRVWKMVGQGGAQMVIGARSALFLPFQNLGLIIVDEEHDNSYKQEDGVLYNARDMAVLRASICGARVVLASATPSLESWANAETGKYQYVELSARFGAAVMPKMGIIDMRAEPLTTGRWISLTLEKAVETRLAAGEQTLLFINRRGYAPVTLCRACGHQIGCDDCDARMVEHRLQNRLMCHQCGETKQIPKRCPSCEVEDKLTPVGPGIERLTEEIQTLFPNSLIAALSSDLYGTARALKAHIQAIAKGEADIILGTQLVAKGHNFPLLTLVGVIDADLSLQGSDLRAAERTFQLMRQVSGRAGRADKPGEALLQTYQPDHPVIRAILSGDETEFWQTEAAQRREAGVPPYGRLAGIVISGPELRPLFDLGNALVRQDKALCQIGAQVYGPAPAPVARVRGQHRVRLLVKSDKIAALQPALTAWIGQFTLKGKMRISVDIDPQSFY
ncbi:MAG: primosomal protein N' [Paracoccaceae bacterium]|nr:primosomal protein N' [Paracoccaceae bacterium]